MQHFALGYDASTVLCGAIERVASTDPKRIREALTETDVETLQTRIRFDAHDGSQWRLPHLCCS